MKKGSKKGAGQKPLSREALATDPIGIFTDWLEDARARSDMEYPNAACLSTLSPEGWPDGRIVLLKGVDGEGFVFYTNYRSAKGKALGEHPRAAMTFYWHDLDRQVRIRGEVERVSAQESDDYFRIRPRGSQIGAWASLQSEPVRSRDDLESRAAEIEERYSGEDIPRPPHWGGYRLRPTEIEFWQGAPNRLHDRLLYRRGAHGSWEAQRLDP